MGAKAKWPAPPPLLASQSERWGGAIQWRPPEFFQVPKMSYVIAWLGQKKINWGYGFAFYSRKDDFGRQRPSGQLLPPYWLLNRRDGGRGLSSGDPSNFSKPPNVIWYCLIRSEKNKLGLWFCFLFKEGQFWRFWPEKPSDPAVFDLKLHSPSPEFFHSPLDI